MLTFLTLKQFNPVFTLLFLGFTYKYCIKTCSVNKLSCLSEFQSDNMYENQVKRRSIVWFLSANVSVLLLFIQRGMCFIDWSVLLRNEAKEKASWFLFSPPFVPVREAHRKPVGWINKLVSHVLLCPPSSPHQQEQDVLKEGNPESLCSSRPGSCWKPVCSVLRYNSMALCLWE